MIDFLIKYYLIRTQFKVLLIWIGVLTLSAFQGFIAVPDSYFAESKNILNVYFAKYNWSWTLGFVVPYALLTSFVYSCEHWKRGLVAVGIRFLIYSGLCYFWTVIVFDGLSDLTGICSDFARNPVLDVTNKQSCIGKPGKHYWKSFDISNHAFTLTLSILVLSSELQVQRFWKYIPTHAAETSPYLAIGSKSLIRLKSRHKATETLLKYIFIICSILCFLCEFSLICTCLYFHDFLTKAFGAAFGIFTWMVTYTELFRNRTFPIYPGAGHLKSLITDSPVKEYRNGAEKKKAQ